MNKLQIIIDMLTPKFKELGATEEEIFSLSNQILEKTSQEIIPDDLVKVNISFQELFEFYDLEDTPLIDIPLSLSDDIYIETVSGKARIHSLIKKNKTPIIEIELENNKTVKVAENHIFPNYKGKDIFAKDAEYVITKKGKQKIRNKTYCEEDFVFDIAIKDPHLYYAEEILNHNSALLVADSANFLLKGKNVLFLTLEMPEKEIAKRIDANLLNVSANEIGNLGASQYKSRINELNQIIGKLIIKEYSAGTFNTIKLKSLLNELESTGFKPDVIVIDYLTLMTSSRTTLAKAGGTYAYYKLIAEELHGFGKSEDMPIVTAAQLNRGSYDNMEAGLDSIADSLGVIQTADTVLAILSNGQLREMNQALLKFLKNRNTGALSSHLIGVDFKTMKFTDMDEGYDNLTSRVDDINTAVLQNAVNQNSNLEIDNNVINFE